MKKLYTLIVAVLLAASTFAQAPEKMSYQAVVRDAANTLVTNQAVGMQISILQGGDLANPGPTVVYSETQTPTTNANGLVTLEIGTGAIVSGIFANIDWSASPYFIQTGTDPTGGANYTTLTSTSQLMSVPFALHTKHAANGLPAGGTDGQILAINAGGNPEWINPPVVCTDIFYADTDDDGYGDVSKSFIACTAPIGYVSNNTDCDDTNATINPASVWYLDADGDNYAISKTAPQCANPGAGYTANVLPLGDCNDNNDAIHPGAIDILDGLDNDCDGKIDPAVVGQVRAGGIVFWVDPGDNTKGKVCALADAPTHLMWGFALDYTSNYVNPDTGTGVYSNWYLPNLDELNLMWLNLADSDGNGVNSGPSDPGNLGGFQNFFYWSSTETVGLGVGAQNFDNGIQFSTPQGDGDQFAVRAVRAF